MAILLTSVFGADGDKWRRELRRVDPAVDLRVWPDHGDRSEIEVILTDTPMGSRGGYAQFPALRWVAFLGHGAGDVLRDPTLPPTLRYYLYYVMQRLRNLRNWISVATGRSGLVRLMSAHLLNRVRPSAQLDGLTLQNLRFSSYLVRCYRGAAARGVRMLSVFTSVSVRHTYKQQMLDAFPEASAGAWNRSAHERRDRADAPLVQP